MNFRSCRSGDFHFYQQFRSSIEGACIAELRNVRHLRLLSAALAFLLVAPLNSAADAIDINVLSTSYTSSLFASWDVLSTGGRVTETRVTTSSAPVSDQLVSPAGKIEAAAAVDFADLSVSTSSRKFEGDTLGRLSIATAEFDLLFSPTADAALLIGIEATNFAEFFTNGFVQLVDQTVNEVL